MCVCVFVCVCVCVIRLYIYIDLLHSVLSVSVVLTYFVSVANNCKTSQCISSCDCEKGHFINVLLLAASTAVADLKARLHPVNQEDITASLVSLPESGPSTVPVVINESDTSYHSNNYTVSSLF